jgi:hypothetical protein
MFPLLHWATLLQRSAAPSTQLDSLESTLYALVSALRHLNQPTLSTLTYMALVCSVLMMTESLMRRRRRRMPASFLQAIYIVVMISLIFHH